jgi:hypothetical protein
MHNATTKKLTFVILALGLQPRLKHKMGACLNNVLILNQIHILVFNCAPTSVGQCKEGNLKKFRVRNTLRIIVLQKF